MLAGSPASPDTVVTRNGDAGSWGPFLAADAGQVSWGGGLTLGKLAGPVAAESGRGAFWGHGDRWLGVAIWGCGWGIGAGGLS